MEREQLLPNINNPEYHSRLRAYWKDRTPQLGICVVIGINFEKNTAEISNGSVRVYPNLSEIDLISPTGMRDSKNNEIYNGDFVEDEETVYEVVWNQHQTSFWLSPIKTKINEDVLVYNLNNQTLGNGYSKRRDLKIIGNKFTS